MGTAKEKTDQAAPVSAVATDLRVLLKRRAEAGVTPRAALAALTPEAFVQTTRSRSPLLAVVPPVPAAVPQTEEHGEVQGTDFEESALAERPSGNVQRRLSVAVRACRGKKRIKGGPRR